jgi:hypothetical protein
MTRARTITSSVVALIIAFALSSIAHAQDLSGLWATDGSKCNQIFTKTGSTYVFAQDSDLHGSGFIIEGRRIITQLAKCDIKTRKQDGETTHLILGCATDVMLSSVQASFKMAQ